MLMLLPTALIILVRIFCFGIPCNFNCRTVLKYWIHCVLSEIVRSLDDYAQVQVNHSCAEASHIYKYIYCNFTLRIVGAQTHR